MVETESGKPLIDPAVAAKAAKAADTDVVKTAEAQQQKKGVADKGGFIWGTGRRKSSIARVRIRPGSGIIKINKREVDEYFRTPQHRNAVRAPLWAIDRASAFDIYVNVTGGGSTGQAGAIMLGVARALKNYDLSFLKELRDGGYLTRDGRMVERKKPGQAGARKRFQFSKR